MTTAVKTLYCSVALWYLIAALNPAGAIQNQQPGTGGAASSAPRQTQPSAQPQGSAVAGDYVIGTSDVLSINVWNEQQISRVLPVRPDGKISLPLVGDVEASGLTPKQLEAALSRQLKTYISNPQVTVIVNESRSQKYNIVGSVPKPGSYPLTTPTTVLDAIATAGGLTGFAKTKKIYVLRRMPNGTTQRFPFNYKQVIKGVNLQENIEVKPGDTIVVP